jgi:Protein of unknown function (DUF2934)
MTHKKKQATDVARSRSTATLDEQQIASRAYQRWMSRGCPVSDGVEDWFAARRELELQLLAQAERALARRPAAKRNGHTAPRAAIGR